MPTKPSLKIDWATHEAAKFAVENWHYSRRMPKAQLVKVGAWEGQTFIGVVIFGVGATAEIGSPYGLKQTQVCELVRVALRPHSTPVSRILAIALKFLKKKNPGLKLVVSFADSSQGHHGGIYQANGWVFTGSEEYHAYRVNGEVFHPRSLHHKYGKGGQSIPWLRANVDPQAERIKNGVKHKYVMPLDAEMQAKIIPLSKPYPKRAGSIVADASGFQSEEGGSIPTPALQLSEAKDV